MSSVRQKFSMVNIGTLSCVSQVLDNEDHRLNHYPIWNDPDEMEIRDDLDFNLIYSPDINVIRPIVKEINRL